MRDWKRSLWRDSFMQIEENRKGSGDKVSKQERNDTEEPASAP